ncbi:MAG: DUF3108 domain-containing protein [Desulfuromonas sp.]|nr:DUF3108 domain-containing protein [Desulfuromonas sp.]
MRGPRPTLWIFIVASIAGLGSAWAEPLAPQLSSSLSLRAAYVCKYFLFDPIAELELLIEPLENGQQRVLLQGHALGVVAWMDGDREQSYESLIEIDGQGTLITLHHQRLTRINSRGRRIEYGWRWTFDRHSSAVCAQRLWGGKVVETLQQRRATECYGDILSLLLAFQREAQPLRCADRYHYNLFAGQQIAGIDVVVETQEPLADVGDDDELFWRCRIRSDAEVFPAGCFEMTLWCNDQRLPVKGRVSRFAGLGTVTATRRVEEL